MSKQEPASAGARAGVMFAIAGLCVLAGLVTIAEEEEARYADGRVVAKDCTVSERDLDGDRFTTCEVRIAYQLDGAMEAKRTDLELVKTYRREKEPFTKDPGPEIGEVLRIDVTGDEHEVVSPTRFEGGLLATFGGALVCALIGVAQLRSGRKRRSD